MSNYKKLQNLKVRRFVWNLWLFLNIFSLFLLKQAFIWLKDVSLVCFELSNWEMPKV